jgi:hypothetical protein
MAGLVGGEASSFMSGGSRLKKSWVGGAARTLVYVSYWSGGFFESYACRRAFTTDEADVIRTVSMSGCQEGDVRS